MHRDDDRPGSTCDPLNSSANPSSSSPSTSSASSSSHPAAAAPSGVVVTGAGGYIGGAIVSYLLEHTDVPRVHATVRGDVSSSRYAALRALDPSTPSSSRRRLHLYSADMAAPGAFDEACRHCSAVIHVAAPTSIRCRGANRAQKVLIDPAIRGIENMVSSVEKMGVDTVVFTSSMSAVQGDGWERGKEHVYTEEDWNEVDTTPAENAYAFMKVCAERRCWDLYKKRDPGSSWKRLVVLCPGLVLGAPATDVRSELVLFMTDLMRGRIWPVIPNYFFSMVHLDDVARAHVLACFPHGKNDGNDGNDETVPEATRLILAAGDQTRGLKDVMCGPVKERLAAHLEARLGERVKNGEGHRPRHGKRHRPCARCTSYTSYTSYSSYTSYTSWFRWPMAEAPKWILRPLSWFMLSVQWPLVRAYVNKPGRLDGGKVVRQLPGFGSYRDPVDGCLDMLAWLVEHGRA